MDLETIRRIVLARHLYELGKSCFRSSNDLHLFAAVNLLQDAVEAFLIAVGEQVGAGIDQNTKFDKYFVAIDSKIDPKSLPFKLKILRLNRVRVDSKHYGIQPARDECERLAVSVREFFDEVATSILGVNFPTVSAIDLLDDGEVKAVLREAKAALDRGDRESCAISCRKILFLEVERYYDVAQFREGANPTVIWASSAPLFAQRQDYIAQYVADPVDYIVLDMTRVDHDLLTKGVDTTEFWNIWRLTPRVYRLPDGTWIWKHDFAKLDSNTLADNAEYVFNATVDFALALHSDRRRSRTESYGNYSINLKREGVPVFRKADRSSDVMRHTPSGLLCIDTDYRVPGIKGDGLYWHVWHPRHTGVISNAADGIYGYIHEDEVIK